jgi:hypothetical protein
MLSTRQLGHFVLKSAFKRTTHRNTAVHSAVLYIGVGDRFDDDRRSIRETVAALQPVPRRTLAESAGRPTHSRERIDL